MEMQSTLVFNINNNNNTFAIYIIFQSLPVFVPEKCSISATAQEKGAKKCSVNVLRRNSLATNIFEERIIGH